MPDFLVNNADQIVILGALIFIFTLMGSQIKRLRQSLTDIIDEAAQEMSKHMQHELSSMQSGVCLMQEEVCKVNKEHIIKLQEHNEYIEENISDIIKKYEKLTGEYTNLLNKQLQTQSRLTKAIRQRNRLRAQIGKQ